MADTKISALTPGAPAVGTDIMPVDRAGTNVSLTAADIVALAAVTLAPIASPTFTGTVKAPLGSITNNAYGVGSLKTGLYSSVLDTNLNFAINGANPMLLQSTQLTLVGLNTTTRTVNSSDWVLGQISELITLSTSGLTTDSVANLLPANSIIEAVTARITTTITTTTNWALGDATIAARFAAANATLTSGTTTVGLQHVDQTGTSGPKQVSAAKLRITCTGSNPGAGVIRVTVFYRQFVAPLS